MTELQGETLRHLEGALVDNYELFLLVQWLFNSQRDGDLERTIAETLDYLDCEACDLAERVALMDSSLIDANGRATAAEETLARYKAEFERLGTDLQESAKVNADLRSQIACLESSLAETIRRRDDAYEAYGFRIAELEAALEGERARSALLAMATMNPVQADCEPDEFTQPGPVKQQDQPGRVEATSPKPDAEPDPPCVMVEKPLPAPDAPVKVEWIRGQVGRIEFSGGIWRPSARQLVEYIEFAHRGVGFKDMMARLKVNAVGIALLRQQSRLVKLYGSLRPQAQEAMIDIVREVYGASEVGR